MHPGEGRAIVSVVRQFGGLDEPQGRKAGLQGKGFRGLHETAAYALALPVRPDGEFPDIHRARLRPGKDASDQLPIVESEEQMLVLCFQGNRARIESVQRRWRVDPVVPKGESGMQKLHQQRPIAKLRRRPPDLDCH